MDLSINVMPLLMTAINLISGFIYTKEFAFKDKLQLYVLAGVFLVILYQSPSGLVLYWTMNNLFSLCKNIVMKCLMPVLEKYKKKPVEKAKIVTSPKAFITGALLLTVLIGLVIPASVISASPAEFISINAYRTPLIFVWLTLCVAIGVFLVWGGILYYISSPKAKTILEKGVCALALIALADYMFFGNRTGMVSPVLVFEGGLSVDMKIGVLSLGIAVVLAVVVLPIWEAAFIKKRKTTQNKHVDVSKPTSRVGDITEEAYEKNHGKKSITDHVQETYNRVLALTFRHPWLTMAIGVLSVVLTFVLAGPNIKVRMLPVADRNQFAVEITLPEGKGLAETKAIADSVAGLLREDERVVSVTSFVGSSSPRFHAAYAPKAGGRHYAQLIVNTVSIHATEEVLQKFEPMSDSFPNAFVKFKQLDYQIFTPFEFRFYGENMDSLHRVANDVMQLMRQDSRVMNVKTDWDDPRPYVEVELDPVTTSQLGMNRTLAELELMLNTGEMQVGQIWEGDYQVPLILKDARNEELDYEGVNNIYLSAGNTSVPLRHIGSAEPAWGETRIMHRNGVRCITVNLEPRFGVYSNGLQTDFRELIETKIDIPEGVRFEVGGEPEDDAETSGTIATSLLIAIVIIFFFLLFNFRTYKLTIVSIAAIAFAFPGMLIGLWIAGCPVGVTAMFGIITLMGMIMRNEILIFEHAEGLRKEGWSARDAAYDAGRRRMVPIFLTTATTAVGVVPMIVAATSFWMPVGVSIFAGGIGSLILVVTMLPVIYWKLYEKKDDDKKHQDLISQTIKG